MSGCPPGFLDELCISGRIWVLSERGHLTTMNSSFGTSTDYIRDLIFVGWSWHVCASPIPESVLRIFKRVPTQVMDRISVVGAEVQQLHGVTHWTVPASRVIETIEKSVSLFSGFDPGSAIRLGAFIGSMGQINVTLDSPHTSELPHRRSLPFGYHPLPIGVLAQECNLHLLGTGTGYNKWHSNTPRVPPRHLSIP